MIDAPRPGRPPGALRVYAVGLADSTGLGMYLAFSAVYLSRIVHLSNEQIGLVLGIGGLASLVGAVPVAVWAQRWGLRRSLVVLFLLRAGSFAGLAAAVDVRTAAVATCVGGVLNRSIGPLVQAVLVGDQDRADAVTALARLRSLRNAGMAAGAIPAGAAVALDHVWAYRGLMVMVACVFVGCALAAAGMRGPGTVPSRGQGVMLEALRDRAFLAVTGMFGALSLSAILLGIGLPLWITQSTRAPAWSVALVQLINTLLVVALQVRASQGSQDPHRARRAMGVGAVCAALAAALTPLSGVNLGASGWTAIACVVTVVVLFSASEVLFSAGATSLVLVQAPPERRATYLATFNLGFGLATVVGPALVAWSMRLGGGGWLAWAAAFAVMALLTPLLPTSARQRAGAAA